jgi:acyl carrier protein
MRSCAEVVLQNIEKLIPGRSTAVPAIEQAHLKDTLGLTSLEMVVLLTEACGELGIDLFELSDVEILRMDRVQDVIDILESKLRTPAHN